MGPIHVAAEKGNVKICKKLIKAGATVDFLARDKKSAVHIAAQHIHVDCLQFLLSKPEARALLRVGDVAGYAVLKLYISLIFLFTVILRLCFA